MESVFATFLQSEHVAIQHIFCLKTAFMRTVCEAFLRNYIAAERSRANPVVPIANTGVSHTSRSIYRDFRSETSETSGTIEGSPRDPSGLSASAGFHRP